MQAQIILVIKKTTTKQGKWNNKNGRMKNFKVILALCLKAPNAS
jgi:hypothetical protein